MRTVSSFFLVGLLLATPALAQSSGGAGGASGGSTAGGTPGGTTGGASPRSSGGATIGSSPSGTGTTTQPGTGLGANQAGPNDVTNQDVRGSGTGLRSSDRNAITNPGGALNTAPISGAGGGARAAANCDARNGNCETPFVRRYMRLVDSMARTACGSCASRPHAR
jgi:hypothetical protein